MAFVLDSFVASSWAFRDEDHPTAQIVLDHVGSGEPVLVPYLFWYELRNVLIVRERAGRIGAADIAAFLRDLAVFDIALDLKPDEAEVLRLARKHRLSVYDAVYLELAMRSKVALATLDKALIGACIKDGVPLLADSIAVSSKKQSPRKN